MPFRYFGIIENAECYQSNLVKKGWQKILEKYSKLYKKSMEKISLNEYIETIVGFNLENNINNE